MQNTHIAHFTFLQVKCVEVLTFYYQSIAISISLVVPPWLNIFDYFYVNCNGLFCLTIHLLYQVAQATSNQMSKRDPLRPYMDVIDNMLAQMVFSLCLFANIL